MAGYYKKRRGPSGPNKNEQKVARAEQQRRIADTAELLGQRYPSVESMTVRLDILSPQQHPLNQENRVFTPADPCRFSVPCPGRCGVGAFDLAAKIEQVIMSGETSSQSSGVCHEPLYAGSSEICGCQLQCRIDVTYGSVPAKKDAEEAPVGSIKISSDEGLRSPD